MFPHLSGPRISSLGPKPETGMLWRSLRTVTKNGFRYAILPSRTDISGGKYDTTFYYRHGCIDGFYEIYFKKSMKLKNYIHGIRYFI